MKKLTKFLLLFCIGCLFTLTGCFQMTLPSASSSQLQNSSSSEINEESSEEESESMESSESTEEESESMESSESSEEESESMESSESSEEESESIVSSESTEEESNSIESLESTEKESESMESSESSEEESESMESSESTEEEPVGLVPAVWNSVKNTDCFVRTQDDSSWGVTTLTVEIVEKSALPIEYKGTATKFFKFDGLSLYGNKIIFNPEYERNYYESLRGLGYIVTYDFLYYTNGVEYPSYVIGGGAKQVKWDEWQTRGDGSQLSPWDEVAETKGEYNTYYLDELLDDPTAMYFYTYDERSTGYELYVGNFRIVDPTTGEDIFMPEVSEDSSEEMESTESSFAQEVVNEWIFHEITERAKDTYFICNGSNKTGHWGEVTYVPEIDGRTDVYRVWAATNYNQSCGILALPKYEKAYYEALVEADASATLEIDFYYEEGSFQYMQNLDAYNAGGYSNYPAKTWHTFSIPFSTILENWDNIQNVTTSLVSFMSSPEEITFYFSGFRIVTSAEEPEVEVTVPVEPSESSEEPVAIPDWTEYGENDGNVNVWTAGSGEKFIQGVDYSDKYANTTLKLAAFQNEKESAQILITPNVAVGYYYLITSNLSTTRGDVLSISNIEIYHQKYVEITTIKSTGWTEGPGWYPDALLPQDAAVRYEENTIALGMNKGIWITFDIPEQQEAGVYTGTFELVIDEQSYLVPVELTVYNYAVSEGQKLINSFGFNWSDVANFEGYASEEEIPYDLQVAYYEFLLDNGISKPGDIPGFIGTHYAVYGDVPEYDHTRIFEDGYEVSVSYFNLYIRDYVEAVAAYVDDPRVAGYGLWLPTTSYQNYDGEGNSTSCVEKIALKKILEEMYEYSMANGVDLFKKAVGFMTWIDEFDASTPEKKKSAKFNLEYMNGFFEDASAYFGRHSDDYPLGAGVSESFRAQVLESLANIYLVSTATTVTELDAETHPMVFCPAVDKYHTEVGREQIDAWAEATGINVKWTYNADGTPPYPMYHIDDYLIAARMYDWMMYEYDVVGCLYWDTTLSWYAYDDADAGIAFGDVVDDFYANPLRYPTANGDGYMLYPGSTYGVKGPVGSIRLQSIRDGIEDYNLLYDLEAFMQDRAADKGVEYNGDTFNTILRSLVDTLYRGTKCTYTDTYLNDFEATKKALAALLGLANEYGVVVENCQIAGDNAVFTVSAPSTATVEFNGVVTSQTERNGLMTYTVILGKDDALNVVCGDYSLTMNAYREVEVYNTWNDISVEETSSGTIYENARYYINNGASYTTVNGDRASKNGPISVVTLTEETAVGGRTEGTYYYIDPVQHEKQSHGFMLLPKEEKSFYENYSEFAKLKFDVYFDMHGDYDNSMRLYTIMGQVGNAQKVTREWYTFEIDMRVILENWDTFHNPTYSNGLKQIALFSLSGTRGDVVGEIFFYIGNFKIEL
ncbi:MAG: DUF4091 domain-containing protein [Clostridia bacterium]|nr:DUF4091 domain-containing protein [Clostridia bacterium]